MSRSALPASPGAICWRLAWGTASAMIQSLNPGLLASRCRHSARPVGPARRLPPAHGAVSLARRRSAACFNATLHASLRASSPPCSFTHSLCSPCRWLCDNILTGKPGQHTLWHPLLRQHASSTPDPHPQPVLLAQSSTTLPPCHHCLQATCLPAGAALAPSPSCFSFTCKATA